MGRWGFFITFEGIEGSGKTTLAHRLAQTFRALGVEVVETREPGGTPEAEAIREALLNPAFSWDPWAEVFAMLASRRENVAKVIRPALARGAVVISDRYMDSTFAYQGFGRGLPLRVLSRLHRHAIDHIKPNLTFLVDLPVEEAFRRLSRDRDRFEQEEIAFHVRVREGYLKLARRARKRFVVLDGTRPVDELHNQVRTIALQRYQRKTRRRLDISTISPDH